jgi:hypothetical protein
LHKTRRKKGLGVKGDDNRRVPPFIEVADIGKKGSGGLAGGHVEARMDGEPQPVTGSRCDRILAAAGMGRRWQHHVIGGH